MTDILERLKAQPKVNGAYLKDIEDAIKEIEELRQEIESLLNEKEGCIAYKCGCDWSRSQLRCVS